MDKSFKIGIFSVSIDIFSGTLFWNDSVYALMYAFFESDTGQTLGEYQTLYGGDDSF